MHFVCTLRAHVEKKKKKRVTSIYKEKEFFGSEEYCLLDTKIVTVKALETKDVSKSIRCKQDIHPKVLDASCSLDASKNLDASWSLNASKRIGCILFIRCIQIL